MCYKMGYRDSEVINGIMRYYRVGNSYTKTAIEISDKEYNDLRGVYEKLHPTTENFKPNSAKEMYNEINIPQAYSLMPNNDSSNSFAAQILHGLAIMIWLVGFILSIVVSLSIGRYSTSFSFGSFILYLVVFFLCGLFVWASAEIFENVQSIANSLRGMQLRANKSK